MIEKGFYLCDDQYYYCTTSNTLINTALKDIYSKYVSERSVEIAPLVVTPDSAKASLKNVKQVTFEITRNCNLKCTYCLYENGNYPFSRASSAQSMELETAKKSLHQIWQVIQNREKKTFTLGFYGGEVYLNTAVMEGIINYTTTLFSGWNLSYTITTNATLLTDQAIHYLIDKNFFTLISLDGPAENHNAKRVFRNGNGTHQVIIKNLQRIKSLNEDYYNRNISLSIVHSKDLSFEKMVHFFQEEALFKNSNLRLSFVNEANTSYYEKFPYDREKFQLAFHQAFQEALKKRKNKKNLSAIEFFILNNYIDFFTPLGKSHFNSLFGTCFYDARLYVDTEGGFHMCEKINDSFQFGNADNGFDFQKMAAITQNYQNLLENCHDCEVKYLCQKCYIHFAKKGEFEMTEEYCSRAKDKIKKMLEDWIRIQEDAVAE